MTEAVKIAQEKRPDLKLEGPLQYDAAVDPEVAKTKVKGQSEVAGRATVCIFPSLDTGNNTYKASLLPGYISAERVAAEPGAFGCLVRKDLDFAEAVATCSLTEEVLWSAKLVVSS